MLSQCQVHLENPPLPALVPLSAVPAPGSSLADRFIQTATAIHNRLFPREMRLRKRQASQGMDVVSDPVPVSEGAVVLPAVPADQSDSTAASTQPMDYSSQADATPPQAALVKADAAARLTAADDMTATQQQQEGMKEASQIAEDKDKEYDMMQDMSSGLQTTAGPSAGAAEAGFVVVDIAKDVVATATTAAPSNVVDVAAHAGAELGATATYEMIPGVSTRADRAGGSDGGDAPAA
jgi:hypothetical protein